MKKVVYVKVAAITAVALLLSSCSGGFNTFTKAYEACGEPSGIELADQGTTLTIDTMGEEDWSGADIQDLVCILDEIKVPTYIRDEIDNTNSLMGRQSAEFDGTTLSWSYHPDNGVDMTIHHGN